MRDELHRRRRGKNLERIHEAQEIAARCVEKLGENPRGDVGRLLGQMLSTLALENTIRCSTPMRRLTPRKFSLRS
jgi:hypothetical protein